VGSARKEGAPQVNRPWYEWWKKRVLNRDLLNFKDLTEITMKVTKDELQLQLNRAQETIAAQVKKIHNLESGHADEFNKWQRERTATSEAREALRRDLVNEKLRTAAANQRAKTFELHRDGLQKTVFQQEREITNLRNRPTVSYIGDAATRAERDLKEEALSLARDFRARAERAERENKDKGTRIVDLLVRAEQAERDAKREQARGDEMYRQRNVAEQRLAEALKPQIEAKALEMPSLMVDVRGFQEVKQTIEALKTERDSALRTADELRLKLDTVRNDRNRLIDAGNRAWKDHFVVGGPVMGWNTLGRIEYLERAVESLRGTIVGGALPRRPA